MTGGAGPRKGAEQALFSDTEDRQDTDSHSADRGTDTAGRDNGKCKLTLNSVTVAAALFDNEDVVWPHSVNQTDGHSKGKGTIHESTTIHAIVLFVRGRRGEDRAGLKALSEEDAGWGDTDKG